MRELAVLSPRTSPGVAPLSTSGSPLQLVTSQNHAMQRMSKPMLTLLEVQLVVGCALGL